MAFQTPLDALWGRHSLKMLNYSLDCWGDESVQVNVLSWFNLLSKCLNLTPHHCHTEITYLCSHQ